MAIKENLIKFDESMADALECLDRQLKKHWDRPERVEFILEERKRVTAIRAELSAQISELVTNNWDFNL